MTANGPLDQYFKRLDRGEIKSDPAQEIAARALQTLFDDLIAEQKRPKQSLFQKITKRGGGPDAPKGLYIHGGVGRGKSMLMDLFHDSLPPEISKRRVHFHEFMIEVHNYIHSRQTDDTVRGLVDQALPSLAEIIARRAHVLCFDEFHVTNITDAMILGRLFRILFEHDVVVIATSNWPPERLYEGGLQRDRFLPFIDLLKEKVTVVHLDSPNDYRSLAVREEGTYFYPLWDSTYRRMDHLFNLLTDYTKPEVQTLEVKGRIITIDRAARGVARFTFDELCARPLGAEDYITIAKAFDVIFLEDVPKLEASKRNEAKRMMTLIDALYEARRRVIISAEVPADQIYTGSDHGFEFERTVSRLLEMQSKDYP